MATSTIFNFNFNNSEIVDSTGQWYDATTGTPTTEFIEHDGNTALLQRAYTHIAGTPYLRDINPVFLQSRDPTFTAHTYTIELQIYPLRDSGGFGPEGGAVLDFNPDAADEENWVRLNTSDRSSSSNTFYWREYGLGPDGSGIPFLTVTAADGTYNRWYSIRIERVDDGTNTGATIKIYVDGTLVVNETLTHPQDARRGRIGDLIRYTYRRSSIDPQGAGVAIDNFKLTAGIAPSSVVDVSLANLQRNNANLLSFIKGKVPTVNDGTLTIQQNGTTVDTFTANSSGDKTVNIQCVDLSNNQTVAGNKEFTGTTTAHHVIPSATDTYNLGGSSYQWNKAYIKSLTINGVACGDILTHNASEFVPRSGGAVLSGTDFSRTVDYNYLAFSGGTEWLRSGCIALYGPDAASSAGCVQIIPALGNDSYRIMKLYPNGTWTWEGTAVQLVSDQRLKQQIAEIDDKLLDAWEDVELSQFKYNDAVKEKSDNARLHTGYVVQQIDSACKSHNVDISKYGLYCHEEYPEETEEVEVEQKDGTKTKERKVIREASEHYSLRYTEVYAVECMYLRRCIARLTARIEELEKGKEQEASK